MPQEKEWGARTWQELGMGKAKWRVHSLVLESTVVIIPLEGEVQHRFWHVENLAFFLGTSPPKAKKTFQDLPRRGKSVD